MSFIGPVFREVFYRPLVNALVLLTGVVPAHDLGLAVIALTILVRIILFPLTHHSIRSQVKMRELEPHIEKIKQEYKDKQEEQARRIMALYKEHGVDPVSGCLMLIIQLPILIALYQVFWRGLTAETLQSLYGFVAAPQGLRTVFLGIVDLSQKSIVLAFLASATQFVQIKLSQPRLANAPTAGKNDMARMMNTQMLYMMPAVIFIAGLKFPAAVGLYWTTMNLFAIMHEAVVRSRAKSIPAL